LFCFVFAFFVGRGILDAPLSLPFVIADLIRNLYLGASIGGLRLGDRNDGCSKKAAGGMV